MKIIKTQHLAVNKILLSNLSNFNVEYIVEKSENTNDTPCILGKTKKIIHSNKFRTSYSVQ